MTDDPQEDANVAPILNAETEDSRLRDGMEIEFPSNIAAFTTGSMIDVKLSSGDIITLYVDKSDGGRGAVVDYHHNENAWLRFDLEHLSGKRYALRFRRTMKNIWH